MKAKRQKVDRTKTYGPYRPIAPVRGDARRRWLLQCIYCRRPVLKRFDEFRQPGIRCTCQTRYKYPPIPSLYSRYPQEYPEWKRIRWYFADTIPEEWKEFTNFLSDMGSRPLGTFLCRKSYLRPISKENAEWGPRERMESRKNPLMWYRSGVMTMASFAKSQKIPFGDVRELSSEWVKSRNKKPFRFLSGKYVVKIWRERRIKGIRQRLRRRSAVDRESV